MWGFTCFLLTEYHILEGNNLTFPAKWVIFGCGGVTLMSSPFNALEERIIYIHFLNCSKYSPLSTSVHASETNLDTKTPEAHVKRSILVRTVETRDGEVRAFRKHHSFTHSHWSWPICTLHPFPLEGNVEPSCRFPNTFTIAQHTWCHTQHKLIRDLLLFFSIFNSDLFSFFRSLRNQLLNTKIFLKVWRPALPSTIITFFLFLNPNIRVVSSFHFPLLSSSSAG